MGHLSSSSILSRALAGGETHSVAIFRAFSRDGLDKFFLRTFSHVMVLTSFYCAAQMSQQSRCCYDSVSPFMPILDNGDS